ncbi:MAG: cation transporter [Thermoguttaceae bacterium]|nr:cation transporter [Thermoguttaceae bacterium]
MNKSSVVETEETTREKVIVRTSVLGVLTNVLLAIFKAIVGLASHSIAVTLDAVNNLSDALSSVVAIIGTKLAKKAPDRKHPFGYGRIEYLSAMIVSGIVLYAGITSVVESIKKIINPETPEYGVVSLTIVGAAVVVKIILGGYVRKQGKRVNSGALVASGSDALFDAILSFSVLVSAIIFILTGVSLEAWVGVLISCFIIKAGVDMTIETLDDILGIRADKETARRVKSLLTSEPEVRGAYDLVLFNYGPEKNYASVHLELPDSMTVDEVDCLTRKLESKVREETGLILVAVGAYAHNVRDEIIAGIRDEVFKKVLAHDWALQVHGFYLDRATKKMRFDVVLSFDVKPKDALRILYDEMTLAFPEFETHISPDFDVSD